MVDLCDDDGDIEVQNPISNLDLAIDAVAFGRKKKPARLIESKINFLYSCIPIIISKI